MNPQGFEKIDGNCDIWLHIYDYLNFLDQLRLSRVNENLRNIFEQFIWEDKYRRMQITEPSGGVFVVTGSLGTRPLIFKYNELQEMLEAYATDIEDLSICDLKSKNVDHIIREFPNLRALKYDGWKDIPLTHYSRLGNKCPNLQKLKLCGNIMPSIKSLGRLRKLRYLSINYGMDFSYQAFRQLCARLSLEGLEITGSMIAENRKRPKKTDTLPLKELKVATSFDPHVWSPKVFPLFLKNFGSLQKLTIRFTEDCVSDVALAALAQACPQLQYLKIVASYFALSPCQTMPLPLDLRDMCLEFCSNLTWENLKALLSLTKLSGITSKATHYEGVWEVIEISPHIQLLDIENVNSRIFRSPHLKELTWYENPNEVLEDYPWQSWSAMESLNIKSGMVPLQTLMDMQYLHTLTLPESMAYLDWSYITTLLSHRPLRVFTIAGPQQRSTGCELSGRVPTVPFPTLLNIMKFPFAVFHEALPFWLEMFHLNKDLQLICSNFRNFEQLNEMLNDKRFPVYLRTIEIWGITLSEYAGKSKSKSRSVKFGRAGSYVTSTRLVARIKLYLKSSLDETFNKANWLVEKKKKNIIQKP